MAGLAGDSGRATRLVIDVSAFRESVHGQLGFGCVLCHQGVADFPHRGHAPVECGNCHGTSATQLAGSVHGRVDASAGRAPATCADCHGSHEIRRTADPQSPIHRLTQFQVCAHCHSDPERMGPFGQEDVGLVPSYLESVHGQGLLAKGLSIAPVCTDCHGERGTGAHQIQQATSPESRVNRAQVVATCGQCHAGIVQAYTRGIHGAMYAAGNPDVPTCHNCHTEHAIQPVTSPGSSVYPSRIPGTCSACHGREEMNVKYGLPSVRRETYLGSFHGLALEAGQLTVANCESCHGAHEILPSSDSASSVSPSNLVATCGRCHPGIGPRVTEGKIHVASVREDINVLAFAVQWMYYALIGGTVVFALAMIALDQYRHRVIDPRRRRAAHV